MQRASVAWDGVVWDGKVDVWLLARESVSSVASLQFFLTQEEKTHADAILSMQRKTEWLGARALSRYGVANSLDCDPLSLVFSKTENGKPFLVGLEKQWSFSISHSSRWIACAVASVAHLGVDIECAARRNRIEDIAERFFSQQEKDVLQEIDNVSLRRGYFFSLWTLKEAFIKAKGSAIADTGLQNIPFSVSSSGVVDPLFALPSKRWQFLHQQFDGDHHLALACGEAECDTASNIPKLSICFWQWKPESRSVQRFTAIE